METLSIVSKKPFSMNLVSSALSKNLRVETSTDNTLVVHGTQSRAYLYPDAELENRGMHRLFLDYSDVELAKSVLEEIANDPALTVDNDFGTVLPGSEFVARCQAEGGWDWLKTPGESPV